MNLSVHDAQAGEKRSIFEFILCWWIEKMFRRETNREFSQRLENDSLRGRVNDAEISNIRARAQADAEASRADAEASRADTSLMGIAVATMAITKLRQANDTLQNDIAQKNAEIERLKDELAISSASRDGLRAQALAFKSDLPVNADSLSDSGQRFSDGSIKNKSRILFEKAFDATARKLGISNPSSRRTN